MNAVEKFAEAYQKSYRSNKNIVGQLKEKQCCDFVINQVVYNDMRPNYRKCKNAILRSVIEGDYTVPRINYEREFQNAREVYKKDLRTIKNQLDKSRETLRVILTDEQIDKISAPAETKAKQAYRKTLSKLITSMMSDIAGNIYNNC